MKRKPDFILPMHGEREVLEIYGWKVPGRVEALMPRHFVSMYTDGPATRWNVIDRQTQEWVRRFPTQAEAQAHADKLNGVTS